MRGIARLGDKCKGTCRAHTTPIEVEGVIITASGSSFMNARGIARLGDRVRADCGHEGVIISASPDAFFDGRPHARLGDQFQGDYTGIIISASTDGY